MFIGRVFLIVGLFISFGLVTSESSRKCHMTKEKLAYDFVIGFLSPKIGESPLQSPFFKTSSNLTDSTVIKCFTTPNTVNLKVEDVLQMPRSGWTHIKQGIEYALTNQANSKKDVGLSVVIGPFYLNLAMILEDLGIPYIVTDYMGFDWSDISRVEDDVHWKNIVEVRPPMSEINSAIVDFFVVRGWESAVMIMPGHPKENQECQNLARQMVANNISPISYSLWYENQSQMRNNTAEVLRNVQLLEQKKIIICSPRDSKHNMIQVVLDEATLFRMLSDDSYSFFILDPTTHLSALSEINMYRKGLFAANCDLYAYRYKDISNDTKDITSGYVYGAKDAANILHMAKINYVTEPNVAPTDVFSRERFLKALKNVQILNAMTGLVKFNATGSRINYTLSLYNHGGIDLYKKIASWSKVGDTPADRITFLEYNDTEVKETRGIFRDVEKVVIVLEEPFIMYREAPKGVTFTGNEQFEGFTIDLINRISEDLQFQYEIVLSPGNAYGVPKITGGQSIMSAKWGGMVGEVLGKRATLGMGAISITSQRQTVIDFSLGVISTGVNILINKPNEVFNIFQFLTPFSIELWMAIIGSSVAVSVVYFILDFRYTDRQFTVKSTLWFSTGTLLMKGSDFSPRRTSQRILTVGFLFFVLITVSTYTANMAAFLTKKNLEEPIDSFEQLASRDDMRVMTVDNSATMNFLKNSPESTVYHDIWTKIERSKGLVPNATYGRKMVADNPNSAFIFDSLINSFSEKKYCKTKSVSAPILLQEHGIAMANGAPFKSKLNIELLRLKESGFIQELRKKWWENTRECEIDLNSRSSKQVSFELEHTAGVFIVGSLGLGGALLMFLTKKAFVYARKDNPLAIRREDTSDGTGSAKSHEEKSKDPLLYGAPEGKQSTV